jgi:hypothetical protein
MLSTKANLFKSLCVGLLLLIASWSPAQSNVKNGLYATYGFWPGYFSASSSFGSITYERLILTTDKKILTSLWGRSSFWGTKFHDSSNPASGLSAYGLTIGASGLTGHDNNHFEYGFGAAYYFNHRLYSMRQNDFETQPYTEPVSAPRVGDHLYLLPAFNLGYRYQESKSGAIVRFGVGFPEIMYLGFGLTF